MVKLKSFHSAFVSVVSLGAFFSHASDRVVGEELQKLQHSVAIRSSPQSAMLELRSQESNKLDQPSPWLWPVVPWEQIASYLDYKTKVHHVNRYVFTAVTTYPWTDILKKGFAHLDTLPRPSGCKLGGMRVSFYHHFADDTPSYILYSLIDELQNIDLINLPYLKKIRTNTLILRSRKIGDAGLIALSEILPQTRINAINLDINRIGLEGITALAQILPLTMIQVLSLSNNYIYAAGVKALSQILPQTQVHVLRLCNNAIGNDSLDTLAQILPQTKIHTLHLSGNRIRYGGAEVLARILPLTQVHTLNLSDNCIGDTGVLSLAKASLKGKICILNLEYNKINKNIKEQLQSQFKHIDLRV